MIKKSNKTFNWEGYNKDVEEYKFGDLTLKELKDWARKWSFKVVKRGGEIYLKGKYGYSFKWK